MSSLGQLSSRLDRHLQVVEELTKAVLALRAQLMDKLDVLKICPDDITNARANILQFLSRLVPTLNGTASGAEEHSVITKELIQAGEQPSDWAEDFGKLTDQLRSDAPVEAAQLDKIMRVVGYLQAEIAEDVRRLRSR